jgi:predicted RND superfamily exporter protein
MKTTFFARYGLLILAAVFFATPFLLRGARSAVQHMKNDVKDWLPSAYDETGDLMWFRDHFLGEQFVMVSWPDCHGDETDNRYQLFIEKLKSSIPPSEQKLAYKTARDAKFFQAPDLDSELEPNDIGEESFDEDGGAETGASETPPAVNKGNRAAELTLSTVPGITDELGLYLDKSQYRNWGGLDEKWLKGHGHKWYFITPNGQLHRWLGDDSFAAKVGRYFQRFYDKSAASELVHDFGSEDGAWYYENPRRLRAKLFKTLTSGPAVLGVLTDPETGVLRNDPEEAKARLTGTLFGPDGKQTCLVMTLTEAAKRDLHLVVGRGILGKPFGQLHEIAQECGIKAGDLHLGGPPVDNVAIDEEGTVTLVRLIGLSVLFGFTLSYMCFRSVTATIMVFYVGGLSAAASVACVYYSGSSIDAIMMSMPSLIYVLGLSGSVHFINYYKQAIEEHGLQGANERAVAHAWKPALLCNITTAIGLVSLYTSEIVPIRKFGLYSALGVMLMLVVVFTYLPAALQMWPQLPKRRERASGRSEEGDESWLDKTLAGFWERFGGFIVAHHGIVTIACLGFIAFTGYGVLQVQTSVNLMKMFDGSAKVIQDYSWLEQSLGRLVPMEVVLKVGRDGLRAPQGSEQAAAADSIYQMSFYDRLMLVQMVQEEIEREFGPQGQDKIGRTISAVTFAPPLPKSSGDTLSLMKYGTSGRLEAYRSEFLKTDYLREDLQTGDELWRISVRLAAMQGVTPGTKSLDHGKFVQDLADVIEPTLEAQRARETILRAIVAARGDDQSYGGANILMVGEPALADAVVSPGDLPAEAKSTAVHAVDRKLVFGRSLAAMLAQIKPRLSRHRLGDGPIKASEIASSECIVIVGDIELPAGVDRSKIVDLRNSAARGGKRTSALYGHQGETTRLGAVYTGVVPIVYKAQSALLESLIQSSLWSFLTITPLMMLVSRGILPGLVAMLPNVLPILVVFGAMGWLGIDVDVGSMMSASIALGVAVDDTIHYLTWFREELDRVKDRKLAILGAFRRCATPTLQAAVISGLGLSIFGFSTFTPTQRFGLLMLTILFAGVAAELIFFPALLAGPLGACFKPRATKEPALEEDRSPPATNKARVFAEEEEAIERFDSGETTERKKVRPHMVRRDRAHRS